MCHCVFCSTPESATNASELPFLIRWRMPVQRYACWAFLVGMYRTGKYKETVPIFRMASMHDNKGTPFMKRLVGYRSLAKEALKHVPTPCLIQDVQNCIRNAEVKLPLERYVLDWHEPVHLLETDWYIEKIEGKEPPFTVHLLWPAFTSLQIVLGQISEGEVPLVTDHGSDPNCYMLRTDKKKRERIRTTRSAPRVQHVKVCKSVPPPSPKSIENEEVQECKGTAYSLSTFFGPHLSREEEELLLLNPVWKAEDVEALIECGLFPPIHSVDNWMESKGYITTHSDKDVVSQKLMMVNCSFLHLSGSIVKDVWLPLGFLKKEYPSFVSHIPFAGVRQRTTRVRQCPRVISKPEANKKIEQAYTIASLGSEISPTAKSLVQQSSWTAETVEAIIEEGVFPPLHSVQCSFNSKHFTKVQCTFLHHSGELIDNVWLPLGFLKMEYKDQVKHLASK